MGSGVASGTRRESEVTWNWTGIRALLPEGFGSLTVGGNLLLVMNQLASLPEGFGSLTVLRAGLNTRCFFIIYWGFAIL